MTASPATESSNSSPPARRFHWLVRTALAMVGTFLGYLGALVGLVVYLPFRNADPTTPLGAITSQILPVFIALGYVLVVYVYMRFVDRRPLREAGLHFGAGSIPLFLLGGAVMLAVTLGASWVLGTQGVTYSPVKPFTTVAWIFLLDLIARSLIQASFGEELLFRGYLLQTLQMRSPWLVATISGLAFGVLHLASSGASANRVLYALHAVAFGFLAATLAIKFRSLWPAIGVHFASYVGTDLNAQWGRGEGPMLWLVVAVALIVLGALVLLWNQRTRPEMPDPLYP